MPKLNLVTNAKFFIRLKYKPFADHKINIAKIILDFDLEQST